MAHVQETVDDVHQELRDLSLDRRAEKLHPLLLARHRSEEQIHSLGDLQALHKMRIEQQMAHEQLPRRARHLAAAGIPHATGHHRCERFDVDCIYNGKERFGHKIAGTAGRART